VSRARFTPVQHPFYPPTRLHFVSSSSSSCCLVFPPCRENVLLHPMCGTSPYTRTSFGFLRVSPTQSKPTQRSPVQPPPTWLPAFYCISVAPSLADFLSFAAFGIGQKANLLRCVHIIELNY